jgi:Protein of unknown function (DUF4238)
LAATKKKQHFVPQCYLKWFADENQHLFVFDKLACKSFKTRVADIAQKHRLYDFLQEADEAVPSTSDFDGDIVFSLKFKDEMPDLQSVENVLSKLEENYAAAFGEMQQTIAKRKPLTRKQKYILSHFIAVQWRRTPEYRKSLIELFEKLATKTWEVTHSGEKRQFRYYPTYASVQQATDMLNPFVNERYIQVLMSHIWIIALNTSDMLLYTSDQPVVKFSRGDLQGFGSSGIQITLPLTPRHALLVCDRNTFPYATGYEDRYIDLDAESVKHYNSLQIRDSSQHTYSQDGDFLFAVEYCAWQPGVQKPRENYWTEFS